MDNNITLEAKYAVLPFDPKKPSRYIVSLQSQPIAFTDIFEIDHMKSYSFDNLELFELRAAVLRRWYESVVGLANNSQDSNLLKTLGNVSDIRLVKCQLLAHPSQSSQESR